MVSFAVTTFCIASYQVFIVMLIETYDFLMADLEEGGGGNIVSPLRCASELGKLHQKCMAFNNSAM